MHTLHVGVVWIFLQKEIKDGSSGVYVRLLLKCNNVLQAAMLTANLVLCHFSWQQILCGIVCVSFAGFDVVTLANNHLYDFASKGVNFTVQVLKGVGIKYFGVNYGTLNSSQASRDHSDWIRDKALPARDLQIPFEICWPKVCIS